MGTPRASARSLPVERAALRKVLGNLGDPPFRLVLWDGTVLAPPSEPVLATVRLAGRRTLWQLLRRPNVGFGDAYADGGMEVDGDLTRLLTAAFAAPSKPGPIERSGLGALLRSRFGGSLRHARRNIHHHYDVGNDFYRLWLDERLIYTCAYFATPSLSLEEAQVAKMDHVCRKLRLRPGERVVEAGCGWGALALHMARRYGVRVRAFNISREQITHAREQARREGLDGRVEFVQDDYRNLHGEYDAFVSVGMLEHVGPSHYRELGTVIDRCLPAQGRGFLHSIGRNRAQPLNAWLEKRIFPGAYPPSLREMMEVIESFDLSVLDVENLRLHYARTAEHWLERYEKNLDRIRKTFDARFARAWRLYLAGTVASFRAGSLQLFQLTFARSRCNEIPWTRAHLYSEGH